VTVTKNARRIAQLLHERAVAEQKAAYADKLRRLQSVFSPPLSNAELSAGLDLRAPTEGTVGISDVGRFLSSSRRLRRARPDGETRAMIDGLLAGDLFFAAREPSEPGGRRPVLVCEEKDVPWLERPWDVRNLASKPIPPRRARPDEWESADVWDLFDEAPAPAPPTAPTSTERRPLAGRFLPPIGLGAMRLSTAGRPDEAAAIALLIEAFEAGVRLVDSADSYCLDHDDVGHNERLIRRALNEWGGDGVLVATKGGLIRPGGKWMPNGRPKHLKAAAEASAKALGVDAIDLYQLHAPHRGVPFADSVGALAELAEAGTIRHVGLCNVTVEQIEEAMAIVPVASVQNKANPFDQSAFKKGVLEACARHGIPFVAHSPVGGHAGVKRTTRDAAFGAVAKKHGVSPHRVALAWLLAMSPGAIAIPGCTRSATLRDGLAAPTLALDDDDLAVLDRRLKWASAVRESTAAAFAASLPDEVVLLTGSPASGKTSRTTAYVRRGYLRLNRDDRGGRLDDLLKPLAEALTDGPRRVVMDNTYPTVKSRAGVVARARAAGVEVRVEHIDIPRGEALHNAAGRMIERHGRLLTPEEMKVESKTDPNMFPPSAITRFFQIAEPPTVGEGFTRVETVPFVRRPHAGATRRALILDYDGTLRRTDGGPPYPVVPDDVVILPRRRKKLAAYADAGWLLLGVSNQSGVATGPLTQESARACFDRTNELLARDIDVRWCPHPAGPIRCWCRKPMPGLGVALLREYGLDRDACLYVGDRTSDATFAANVGMAFAEADAFFSTTDGPTAD